MPESNLALLTRAANAAAQAVEPFLGTQLDVTHKADNAGPVTNADHAANAALERVLREARPDYGWLSEESPDDPLRLAAERTFIVDPIDGTRSFIEGSRTWAHALAIAERGVVTAGVVFLPQRDKIYTAELAGGARLNGTAIRPAQARSLAGAEVLATKPNLSPTHWRNATPVFNRSHRPSLAYRMCLVAEGRYDAMLTFRPAWEWDIAAGALILSEAGACASDKSGAPLRFNNAHPQANGVVAANADLHADIMGQLAPVGGPVA